MGRRGIYLIRKGVSIAIGMWDTTQTNGGGQRAVGEEVSGCVWGGGEIFQN